MDLALDNPKKKSRVQPIKNLLTSTSTVLPPPIPVSQLQKTGVDYYGMLPEEVSDAKLLQPKK